MANIVTQVTTKQPNGTIGTYSNIGATFDNVLDVQPGDNKKGVSLKQFFSHYLKFLKNNIYIYRGEEEPTNNNVGIWIDTSEDAIQNPTGTDYTE